MGGENAIGIIDTFQIAREFSIVQVNLIDIIQLRRNFEMRIRLTRDVLLLQHRSVKFTKQKNLSSLYNLYMFPINNN